MKQYDLDSENEKESSQQATEAAPKSQALVISGQESGTAVTVGIVNE